MGHEMHLVLLVMRDYVILCCTTHGHLGDESCGWVDFLEEAVALQPY